ncbi:MAG: hypothetical protein QOK15_547, partial [Nocardioidaceae bacterium]|nr:hypothetical protein [Nocardioidaceae bacterium]
MADAEIIPIGGRRRPGRGSPTSPSAAARSLVADPTAAPQRRSAAAAARQPVPAADPRGRAEPDAPEPVQPEPVQPEPVQPEQFQREPVELRPSADDAADSLADAAREVFEDSAWQQRLRDLTQLLRRRLTGDYEVDEFGFDAEVTERLLLTALRPLA